MNRRFGSSPADALPRMGGGKDVSRRQVLALGAGVLATGIGRRPANAQPAAGIERHGISAFGDLKYPADFKHFAYVNPDAPKGGAFSHIGPTRQLNQSFLTFNSLNAYVLRGDSA